MRLAWQGTRSLLAPRTILFRKYIFSFSSLDTIKEKGGLKIKLADDCIKGRIDGKFFNKFSTLFDHIEAIKEAERTGKTELK